MFIVEAIQKYLCILLMDPTSILKIEAFQILSTPFPPLAICSDDPFFRQTAQTSPSVERYRESVSKF